MTFRNILTVVPLIAISGCSLDEVLQTPATNKSNTHQDAGDPRALRVTVAVATEVATPGSTKGGRDAAVEIETLGDPFTNSAPPSATNATGHTTSSEAPIAGDDDTSSYPTDSAGSPSDDSVPSLDAGAGTTIAIEPPADTSTDAGIEPTTTADDNNDGEVTDDTQGSDSADGETNPDSDHNDTDGIDAGAACEVLLSERFDDITTLVTPSGWAMQNHSEPLGVTGWIQGDASIFLAHSGEPNSYVGASYSNADAVGTISNWLLTPELPLVNGSVLAFWTRSIGNEFPDRLQVRMSTNGDSTNVGTSALDVGDFSAQLLDINPAYGTNDYPTTFTRFEVTLSGLTEPSTGRLAFRYFVEEGGPLGANSDYIGIDMVSYPFCGDSDPQDDGTEGDDTNDDTSPPPDDAGASNGTYHLALKEGDGQTGLVGYSPNINPVVQVLDESGAGVDGIEVTFEVVAGGGMVAGAVQLTDANGYAQPEKWTLGQALGANELRATIDGDPSPGHIAFEATGVGSAFDIELEYLTAMTETQRAVFEAARLRWQELIIGDLPDVFQHLPANTCGTHPAITGTFDDLTILVSVGAIDGVNGVLGQAGPCAVRAAAGGLPLAGARGLPFVGIMRFDSADLDALANAGQLDSVILHEMGHVLGVNSFHWRGNSFLQNPIPTASPFDTHFTGPRTLEAFAALDGGAYTAGAPVPVENCVGIPGCGAGTYNSHWRESVLDNELMTGYISADAPNPLSRVTVASLWDIGYAVNLDGADPYTNNFSNLFALQTMPQRTQLHELPYDGPIYVAGEHSVSPTVNGTVEP